MVLVSLPSRLRTLAVVLLLLPLATIVQPGSADHGISPTNDDFADALELTNANLPYNEWVETAGTTIEPDEPNACGADQYSIWYKFTPSEEMGIRATFNGGGYRDVVGAVYTGSSLADLTLGRCESFTFFPVEVHIPVVAGTTYYFQVAGEELDDNLHVHVQFETHPLEPNDNFADALPINSLVENRMVVDDLTLQDGEQQPCTNIDKSGWYRYDATLEGTLVLYTFGQYDRTGIAAYTGTSLADLELIDCDDWSSLANTYMHVDVEPGTTYFVQVGVEPDSIGTVRLTGEFVAPEPHDDLATAKSLSTPSQDSVRLEDATVEANEPTSCVRGGNTVWYSYTAPQDGTLVADLRASDFDALAAAYIGTGYDNLVRIACMPTYQTPPDLRTTVEAGTTYLIQVGSELSWHSTRLEVTFDLFDTPANDDFADAQIVDAIPVQLDASTLGATGEEDEENSCFASPEASRWYGFTPTSADTLRASLIGSPTQTDLIVYTGNTLASLNEREANCTFMAAGHLQFEPTPGTRYWFQVLADDNDRGEATLEISQAAAPANDDIANAQDIVLPFAATIDTRGATSDPDDPDRCSSDRSDVWFRFTAPRTGWYLFGAEGDGFNAEVGVFTDEATPEVARCSSNYLSAAPSSSIVDDLLTAGQTYLIQVGSNYGHSGDITFTAEAAPRPVNDDRADATPLTAGVPSLVSLAYASVEDGEDALPCGTGDPNTNTVWNTFVAPRDGVASWTASRGGGTKAIYVEQGGELVLQECGFAHFAIRAGQTYWIQHLMEVIAHYSFYNYDYDFTIDVFDSAVNDNFADALPFAIDSSITVAVDARATDEIGEPQCADSGSIWYKIEPTETTWVRLTSPYIWGYHVAVHSGTRVDDLTQMACATYTSDDPIMEEVLFAGRTYYVQIDQWISSAGPLQLDLISVDRPVNDMLRHAAPLEGLTAEATRFTYDGTGTTREPGEPRPCIRDGRRTMWYEFDAPAAGVLTLDTRATAFDTQMAAYVVTQAIQPDSWTAEARDRAYQGWNTLTKLGCADLPGGGEQLMVAVAPGQTYYVQVSGIDGRTGTVELDAVFVPEP